MSSYNVKLVSIIVPVYNIDKYIGICINNVIAQSYEAWELILIDDGSTDMSGIICDNYAKKDSRIKVIHKSNSGVSDSRNMGLDIALGKYIIFLDSDDYWFENTALEQLVMTAEKYNLDIIRGEYKAVNQEGETIFNKSLSIGKKHFSNKILTSDQFYTKILDGENFIWLYLFKKDAIGSLRFNSNRVFLEDMEFIIYLFLNSLNCMYLPFCFYAYRKNCNSASHIPKIQNLVDSFTMSEVFYECAQKAVTFGLKDAYRYNSIMMYYWTLDTMSHEPYYKRRLNLIKDLSLKKRSSRIRRWAITSMKLYPLPIYIYPLLGIYYFRIKHRVGSLLRKVISYA